MSEAAVYKFRWHVPLEKPEGGWADEFAVAGYDGKDPVRLRREILRQIWPVGTIFHISRTTGGGRVAEGQCFLEQIRVWRPSLNAVPRFLPVAIPRSRSLDRVIFSDLLMKALSFAVEHKLSTPTLARECRTWILRNMKEPV